MFNDIYKEKKVLITGNTGFKGSWLTAWLLKLEADVYGISDKLLPSPSMCEELELHKKITHFMCDIRNFKKLTSIIEDIKPDFVFHLAAQPIVKISYTDPIDTITTNVIGTTNVLEALKRSNHKCIGIIITSDKCYNNVEWEWGYREIDQLGGKDIYSGSKAAAEMIINSYYHSFFKDPSSNVEIASARAGNVIGGGDWAKNRIIPDCVRAWVKDKQVEIRSPNSTRPWQHVLEPLNGYLTLGQSLYQTGSLNGQSFNFGPSTNINKTVVELISDFSNYFTFRKNKKGYKIIDDMPFHEASLLKLNCDKATVLLNWKSVLSYEELMQFMGNWYKCFYSKSFYNIKEDMYKLTLAQIAVYEDLMENNV